MDDDTVDAEWHSLVAAWFSRQGGRWSIRFTRHTPLGFPTLLAPFSECCHQRLRIRRCQSPLMPRTFKCAKIGALHNCNEPGRRISCWRCNESWKGGGPGVVELQSMRSKKNSINKCCYSEQWSLTMVHPGISEMRQSMSAQSR